MEQIEYEVLLVEDDKLDQMAFTRMTEKEQLPYDCTIATSIGHARELLASQRFDVVVCDYMLGDGTAFDLLELAEGIPVIFVTGVGDEEIAINAWQRGAYDYLVKDHEHRYLKKIPVTIENAVSHERMANRLRLLSHAIVSTNDSVYITDLQDKITFVNKAFCETYGYQEEEIIGKDCNILWENNPSQIQEKSSYDAVNGWEVGFFHQRKDGSTFPVSLSRSDVKDEKGKEVAVVVVSRDISERMQVESELRNSNRELVKRIRQKRELLIAFCSQLLSPVGELRDIINQVQTEAADVQGSSQQQNLATAVKDMDKIETSVRNVLDLARVEPESINVNLSDLELKIAVSNLLQVLSPFAADYDTQPQTKATTEQVTDADWARLIGLLKNIAAEASKVAEPACSAPEFDVGG